MGHEEAVQEVWMQGQYSTFPLAFVNFLSIAEVTGSEGKPVLGKGSCCCFLACSCFPWNLTNSMMVFFPPSE